MKTDSKGHSKAAVKNMTVNDFAGALGIDVGSISENCRNLISGFDFRYNVIEERDKEALMLEILKKIDSDKQIIGAPERQGVWEKGWEDNLKDFISSGYDLDKLVPRFIRPGQAVRLNQNYIAPVDPNFELNCFTVFRQLLIEKYVMGYENIYEFGCGTGFNLVAIARTCPGKYLFGLDFTGSSVNLVNKIGEKHGWKMEGRRFDMINPDRDFKIKKSSMIFTIGAVEQLAGRFEMFMNYLIENSPELCFHVEPAVELYDESNLVDYLAIKFHKKRGYTQNFLPYLEQLAKKGDIRLLKVKRLYMGNKYMEGYSLIVWQPARI